MVTTYTPAGRTLVDSSPVQPTKDKTMVAHGQREATVPETAETPSPPNAGDLDLPPPAQIGDAEADAPGEALADAFGDDLPCLETPEETGEEVVGHRTLSPVPLIFPPEALSETPLCIGPPPVEASPAPPEQEQEYTAEYVADCLKMLEEFKKNLQEFPSRSGPPFRVADGQPFDCILRFLVKLAQEDFESAYKQCINFFQENLSPAFTKLYTDDGLSSWSNDVQVQIFHRSRQAIQLIALKMSQDYSGLLELLAVLLNPTSRFMNVNSSRHSETFPTVILPPGRSYSSSLFPAPVSSDSLKTGDALKTEDDVIPPDVYARCYENRSPRGYLVDYLNIFGRHGGFDALHNRIVHASEQNPLTISLLVALLKPFGTCADYLTKTTVERYFLDVFQVVPRFLETMSDEDFKKESGKQDGKSDPVTNILRSLKLLAKVVPEQSSSINQAIEVTRLSAIMKLLKVSTYNGKMHALNEINRIIQSLSYTHRPFQEDDSSLGAEKVAKWFLENRLLSIILSDSMHQPQYSEKLEKIIRFLIRERSLTIQDLDDIWAAQSGKHEAIVKNVHDLLTKLAWDFTPPQLDHLFGHFQGSWVSASRRQREKLLELIRRLAEDDKEGVMAIKVLDLLWSLCHNDELPAEIMDQALAAHLKIIDYTCTQDRDGLKMGWLRKCVEEISRNVWVIPALRHIKNICDQYPENNSVMVGSMGGSIRSPLTNRTEVLNRLIQERIIPTVVSSLEQYLHQARHVHQNSIVDPAFDPMTQDLLNSKFSHFQHVDERLNFLRYVLQQGHTFLDDPYNLWSCLAENPVFEIDRDLCFLWFCKVMAADDPYLRADVINHFYDTKVLQLDPQCLTEAGLQCFRGFLCYVNTKEGKLEHKRKLYYLNQFDLTGIEYLWKVILSCKEETSQLGIDLLRDLYALPSSKIQADIIGLHRDMITECVDRLRPIHDNLDMLKNDKVYHSKVVEDANKAVRILKVITEYVQQFDKEYDVERSLPPLSKATYGIGFMVTVKCSSGQQRFDDVEIFTHTNDSIGGLRRMIYQKYRLSPGAVKLELFHNNDLLSLHQDRRLITDLGFDHTRERLVITVKFGSSASYGHGILPDMTTHSSPESSNDVSPVDTPQSAFIEEISVESEKNLPGVWVASQPDMMQTFVRFADLGSRLDNRRLLNAARDLLGLLPADESIVAEITAAAGNEGISLDALFHAQTPSKALYNLQVLQSLLLPARFTLFEQSAQICAEFMARRPLMDYILNMLTRNNFTESVDSTTKQQWCQSVLRLVKLVLHVMYAVGWDIQASLYQRNSNQLHSLSPKLLAGLRRGFPEETLFLLGCLRCPVSLTPPDYGIRVITQKVAQLHRQGVINLPKLDTLKALRHFAWTAASGSLHLLDGSAAEARIAIQKRHSQLSPVDVSIAEEALDCLMLCFPLTPNSVDDVVTQKEPWLDFLEDMIVICQEPNIRRVAMSHFSQIGSKCTNDHQPLDSLLINHFFHCIQKESKQRPETCDEIFRFVATLLKNFNYFNRPLKDADAMLKVELDWLALCRRLCAEGGRQDIHDTLLEGHLLLIKEIVRTLHPNKKRGLRTKENRPLLIQELIEDFLFPTARVLFRMANQRHNSLSSHAPSTVIYGNSVASSSSSNDLFDAAYSDPLALLDMPSWARPICQTPASITAAFEVITQLCHASAENLTILTDTLTLLFYSESESPITEWEYSPPVGPRRTDGFVGLKNAGATCYMNSVLQQLYMIPTVRNGILTIEGIANNYVEEELDEKVGEGDGSSNAFVGPLLPFGHVDDTVITGFGDQTKPEPPPSSELIPVKAPAPVVVQDYNAGLIKQMQVLFSHLACSKLQFFIPRGFWKHFRMGSEPVNLREQHDAMEFYNSVVDCVDEGLKSVSKAPLMVNVLGGTFADQKICRDCPHRYSKETPFTSLSLDIRNFHTLQESLENYVKGDVLEGANAYMCEKCERKVDTVKRLCIKRLPPVLMIQLKRFDYDWEREQAIKSNDYFEFPRQVDLEPYTAAGLAKIDGYTIQSEEDVIREVQESSSGSEAKSRHSVPPQPSTLYRLVGIVVHSGQATGGHYYSYILDRDGEPKWYRFDDGDVTECKIDDDDELKAQCFGEELPGQKRWWNAYLLFYERIDNLSRGPAFHQRERPTGRIRMQSESIGAQIVHMIPSSLRNVILKQNLKFVHSRSQFIPEYFTFLKHLLQVQAVHLNGQWTQLQSLLPPEQELYINQQRLMSPEEIDSCALAVVQLLGKFIFDVCFRTRRTLRGPANEWSDSLLKVLQTSASARLFFTEYVVYKNSRRILDYLLECPSQDIRNAFSRALAHLSYYGRADRPCPPAAIRAASLAGYHFSVEPESLEDLLLRSTMMLVERKEISDYSRHIGTFLNVFIVLTTGDEVQRETLIRLGVPELLIKIAIDDVPFPLFKYNVHSDITRLFGLVSTIVLSIDFDDIRRNCDPQLAIVPNPYAIESQRPPLKASQELCQLFMFNSVFLKRLVDDALHLEEVKNAIRFLCWENPDCSQRTLGVILNALSSQYIQDMRQLMEFAFTFIQLEDSWLLTRMQGFFYGYPSDAVEGFLSILTRNRQSNPRRGYLLYKYMVLCLPHNYLQFVLTNHEPIRVTYMETYEWLQQELQSNGSGMGNRYYNNTGSFYSGTFSWNNQIAISNETSSSSHLERTSSARNLADKAFQYMPEETDMALPTINSAMGADEEEEEEDDDAIGFEAGAPSNFGHSEEHFQEDVQRVDDDHWPAGDYSTPIRPGDGQLSFLGPSHYSKANGFISQRRNGALHDDVKEKLITGGILHHTTAALDDEEGDSLQMNSALRSLHIQNQSSGGSTLQADFRPGTPVQGEFWNSLEEGGGPAATSKPYTPPS